MNNFVPWVISQYGLMGSEVMRRANVTTFTDLGDAIFFMTDIGMISKTKDDKIEDFIERDRKYPMINEVVHSELLYKEHWNTITLSGNKKNGQNISYRKD